MAVITHNKSRRCPAGSRRVKGTTTSLVCPMGLGRRTKPGVGKRKVKMPVAEVVMPMGPRKNTPMVPAVPIPYNYGLDTQLVTPIEYAITK